MNTILICLIICSIYSFVIYQFISRKINKKIDNKTFLNDVRDEINSLITQINETSDRNVLLIENRLERLSSMLSASDKKLSSLRQAAIESVVEDRTPVQVEIEESKPEVLIDPEGKDTMADDSSLSRRERILLLHRQGISPTVIASQTKATVGEVELVISLSRG